MRHHRYLNLALVAGGLLIAAPLAAQQSPPKHGPAARLLERRKDLQLTDAQVKKLESLDKTQAPMVAKDDSLIGITRSDWEKARADAMAVLTPQQREKADSLRKEYHDQYSKDHESKGHPEHRAPHDSTPG
jgi:Spy/CpxP family protein refolding chaperone